MFTLSFLFSPPHHHHKLSSPTTPSPTLEVPSPPPTRPKRPPGPWGSLLAWVLGGGGGGVLPVMNSSGTLLGFITAEIAPVEPRTSMKTNKSKYQELIQALVGIAPTPPGPPTSEFCHIYMLLQPGVAC